MATTADEATDTTDPSAAEAADTTDATRPELLFARVEELQTALEDAGDSPTRDLADELVGAVMAMYGAGLEHILAALQVGGETGQQIAGSLADDPLVATLLLIHDLHPIPLDQRVQAALDSVRPYMESHGGNVTLLSVDDGIARIHLQGSCSDCSASSATLELAIKGALEQAAPDLEGLEVTGVAPQTMGGVGLPMVTGSAPAGIELPIVMSGPSTAPASPPSTLAMAPAAAAPPPAAPAWFEVHSVGQPAEGTVVPVAVAGEPLAIANVDGTLLAYRDICASCGGSIHDGELAAGTLSCRHCARAFFLPRAGRSLDDDHLQLDPVPLLSERGVVKVALAT